MPRRLLDPRWWLDLLRRRTRWLDPETTRVHDQQHQKLSDAEARLRLLDARVDLLHLVDPDEAERR